MPHSKSLSSYWRRIPQWYRLEGVECSTCGQTFFPARTLCPECRREGKLSKFTFGGKGKIYSYTVVHAPPQGFELHRPYIMAIIELDEGPMMTAQIVDCDPEDVDFGMKVTKCFRKVIADSDEGIIRYAYKFKPKKG